MNDIFAAIGIFDGVHLGHKKIIVDMVAAAKKAQAASLIITFDPHPLKVLTSPRPVPMIMSTAHRIKLIRDLGVDGCRVIRFDKEFSRLSPVDFTKKVLVDKFHLRHVFVGDNFTFGRGNSGNAALLKKLGARFGFDVTVVRAVKQDGRTVSSTLIRKFIVNGWLCAAARMLGRPVTVFGTVVEGAKRGRLLGYPTANINPHHEAIPPSGVYAVKIIRCGKIFPGVLFIGKSATFGEEEPTIEAHILDFRSVIYGEDIEIVFVGRLRGIKKFADRQKLLEQIRRDDFAARKALDVKAKKGIKICPLKKI